MDLRSWSLCSVAEELVLFPGEMVCAANSPSNTCGTCKIYQKLFIGQLLDLYRDKGRKGQSRLPLGVWADGKNVGRLGG